MMSEQVYRRETAVTANGDGSYGCLVSPHWNIGTVPNGGYVLATLLRAAADATGRPDPLSVTGHFLRPAVPDAPGLIRTELVRPGRTASTVRAQLEQEDKVRLLVTAAMGELVDDAADPELTLPAPAYPAPEQCPPRTGDGQGVELPIADRLDLRLLPEFVEPGGSGRAEMGGWVRLLGHEPLDTIAVAMLADTFPPSIYQSHGRIGWVPTIELTVHVRRRPAPGWLAIRLESSDFDNGLIVEDGTLWDMTGALVGRSRQLALFRPA